ncbi:MAG: WxL domain-containing protein, partial [Enterococcus thailandicus]|nr:WxL domain-containing protein [Enterococcus thailandicus]
MKKMVKLMSTTLLFSLMAHSIQVAAEETFPKEYNSEGIITFEAGDEEVTPPVDPENPDPTDPVDPVDPPGPGTGGALSIDYGS